ncbi:Stk1 family PASTA domain-containing Ser/Thr kinase [Kocuria palustris]|uniref:Stk1 family PASTA domain-containing Ser/Thr kinase n=1 Tax=Kocuria palustris TaxID=71999 RepID=UPI0011A8F864|nr:Stk1 family PASTA domain-containing Ser/Thr kinase [Kocuria palustris]
MQKPVDDHLTGTVLEGRYTIGPRLARGGTAGVHRAVDERLDRTVAVKIMHPHLTEDPSFVDRFAREARAAARLSHPAVVAVLDQGRTDDGLVFLVMEYVEGGTLRDVLRRKRFLRPGEALTILAAVASGLGAAHGAGLIHRDIKPENVLMRPDGTVKVADFGLSRAAGQHTASGAVLGTVAYAAPELVTEQSLDARSDLYSLGVMAWEMLTGRRPFDGSPWAIARAHAEKPVPSLLEAVPGIDLRLAEAVSAWTAKDPAQRPSDGAEIAAMIGRLRRELDPDALDHVPGGWEQGPGPAAPQREDPGATILPRTAPATGPIDLPAVGRGADDEPPITQVLSVPLTGRDGLETASHSGSTRADASSDEDADPSADPAGHRPPGRELGREASGPGVGGAGFGLGTGAGAAAGATARGEAPGDHDTARTTVLSGLGGAGPRPPSEDEARTEALPGRHGAVDDDRTEALPDLRSGWDEEDDASRTSVLPPLGRAAAAGTGAGAGAAAAGAAATAGRSGSTAVHALGGDAAGGDRLGASVDPEARRESRGLERLAAFDDAAEADGRDGDTIEQDTRSGLQESAPVDPSKPTVRLQRHSPLRIAVALALAVLLTALAGFLGWILGSGSFRTAVVPEVAGTSQEVARSAVETEGFSNVAVHEESSTEVPEGSVIGTTPDAGSEARVGEQIVLSVSTGPEQVEIPSVEGLAQSEAQTQLTDAGLSVGSVSEQFDEADEGTVVSASPAPGSRVAEGTSIDLIVSIGPQPEDVPRVVGRDADDARGELEELGFTVEVEEVAGGNLNRVVSQDQDGTTITLRVI